MTQAYTEEAQPQARRGLRSPLDGTIAAIANRIGGKRAREVERFLKFAVVGVSGAIIDFGLLFLLQATILPPVDINQNPLHLNVALATGIAFFTAVISNFVWTTLWVYPDSFKRSRRRQLAQFTAISVIGGVSRTLWITASFLWLGSVFMPVFLQFYHIVRPDYVPSHTAEAKLGTIVAQLIGMAVVMLWNFFANRYWTYGDVS